MKKFIFTLAAMVYTVALMASEPLWLRYPAISPDGKTIAFNYKGDIYLVSSNGGKASCLVSHKAYDYTPVWSPDGSHIAFASDRYGNFDIFTIPASGGEVNRVTTHSNDEVPWSFTPDGSKIYFSANLQTSAQSRVYTKKPYLRELYAVQTEGGAQTLVLPTSAEEISPLASGEGFFYQDRPGAEEIWRKHHTSAAACDIWLYKDGKHTKLTDFNGEDRVPRLAPDGKNVYFLSERDGSFNLYSFSVEAPSEVTRHTYHELHPVRSLTIADNGTLCYSYDGSIYIKRKDGKSRKLKITVNESEFSAAPKYEVPVRPSDCAAVSPDGSQMVFAFRGELYVTSTDTNPLTRRITNSVASEADPVFSPDGRTLVYASEKSGKWNLYRITLGEEDDDFITAANLVEEPLLQNAGFDRRMPLFSPDGKELSFIENRDRLMVMNLADAQVRQVTDGSHISQTWGVYPYSWSPDGKWFVLEGDVLKHKTNILLVNASGKEPIINLTRSGYPDTDPVWALGGDAILFMSQRYGMYDQSRVGGGTKSLFIFYLNKQAEERYVIPQSQHQALGIASHYGNGVQEVKIDSFGFNDRIGRLTKTTVSNIIADRDGNYAYGIADKHLVRIDLHKPMPANMEILGKASGKLAFDRLQENIFILGSKPQKYELSGGKFSQIAVSGSYEVDAAAEYLFMFDHISNEMQRRFYDRDMHGVDWKMYCEAYRKFVPHINNNYDFSEMCGELLGELNVSHTGLRYARPVEKWHDATGELGLYTDYNYKGGGLKVTEVLLGGPFDISTSRLEAGDIIEAIDDVVLAKGMDYYPLLNHKAGKAVKIRIRKVSGEIVEETVFPVTREKYDELIYQRWMARNAEEVERLSGGRIGYVHLDFMNKPAYHHLYLTSLGRYYHCDALVFDVRDNGGGSLHPRIEEFFSGTQYWTGEVRGMVTKSMPRRRWIYPSAMLINAGCYSDGHGTPWVYDHLDLGTTVGMPIPGSMTTCNREKQRDETLILGVPIVGFYMKDGRTTENTQTEPDVRVENRKEDVAAGKDQQLESIVNLLLDQIDTHPKRPWKRR